MRIRIIGALVALVLAGVGGFVLYVYVSDADRRAHAGAELVEVFVVTEAIPAGSDIAVVRDRVEVDELPAIAVLAGGVTSFEQVEGLVSTTELLPGEQLLLARFADPASFDVGQIAVPEGKQEVTIALPVARVVGGAVQPGSEVGMVVTVEGLEGGTTSRFSFNRLLVTRLQAGQEFGSSGTGDNSGPVTIVMVTFAVSAPEAERIVWAAERYEENAAGIWLTLQSEDAVLDGSTPINLGNILP